MSKTAMTHARLTPEVKESAEAILKELGISISAAYEMFYSVASFVNRHR